MDRNRELEKKLIDHFKKSAPNPEQQTLICTFLQTVHGANASILFKIEFQKMDWTAYKCLHEQYYKNLEFITLLIRATHWSYKPVTYLRASKTNISFLKRAKIHKYFLRFFKIDSYFYEYLAFSHALMSEIRFLPLFPPQWETNDPFLSTLNKIEEENGRQIQVQIRLLKDVPIDLTLTQKEHIIEQQRKIVKYSFDQVLIGLLKTK